jgi:hypothetical protein
LRSVAGGSRGGVVVGTGACQVIGRKRQAVYPMRVVYNN